MGMVLVMRRVDNTQLAMLRADPDQVPDFAIEDEAASDSGELIDFDKAWHALHFLFTGHTEEIDAPLSLLRGDYEPLGEDLGYGPAQYWNAATTQRFRDALFALSDDDLRCRYDPAAMARAKVYLADTLAREGDEGWDYVAQGLPALRKLADACAETGSGVIVTIT